MKFLPEAVFNVTSIVAQYLIVYYTIFALLQLRRSAASFPSHVCHMRATLLQFPGPNCCSFQCYTAAVPKVTLLQFPVPSCLTLPVSHLPVYPPFTLQGLVQPPVPGGSGAHPLAAGGQRALSKHTRYFIFVDLIIILLNGCLNNCCNNQWSFVTIRVDRSQGFRFS